jgi:hypothetical protein
MVFTLTTEWSQFEYDDVRPAIRWTRRLAPPYGPLAHAIDPITGEPICFKEAVRDDDGWVEVDHLVTLEVGQVCEWVWYEGHPHPNYRGSRLLGMEA